MTHKLTRCTGQKRCHGITVEQNLEAIAYITRKNNSRQGGFSNKEIQVTQWIQCVCLCYQVEAVNS